MSDKIEQLASYTAQKSHEQMTSRYHDTSEQYCYPAEEFEEATGLSGIAKHYIMPDDKDPFEVYQPLGALQIQAILCNDISQALDVVGSGEVADVEAYHEQAAEKFSAFKTEYERDIDAMSLDEAEALTAKGYKLQAAVHTSEDLLGAAKATQGLTKDDVRAVSTQVGAELEAETQKCYETLEELNPELSVLTPQIETHHQRWGVVNGALSRFNIPDIKCFSIDGTTGVEARKDPAWSRRQEQLESEAGSPTYWIPSPSTQHLILQQTRQRDAVDRAVAR